MTSSDQLLSEFIDAWNAGKRPDVSDYVERAPAGERDELAGLINVFLQDAPTPPYSEEALAAIRSDPLVGKLGSLLEVEGAPWPSLLPRLRARARLTRDQVVSQLSALLGVTEREEKVKRYYHQMETGTLDPEGVSGRVLDALAGIFGIGRKEIEKAGDLSAIAAEPALEMQFRATDATLEVDAVRAERLEHAAAHSPVPEQGWDEVDHLFLGGR
jgi:hypothetical protein